MKKGNPQRGDDHRTQLAKKEGYLARSVYKLAQLDERFGLFQETTQTVLDIGCAPGSRLQRGAQRLPQLGIQDPVLVWLDIQETQYTGPGVHTFVQDITDREWVQRCLDELGIQQFDCILSDMAPATMGRADIDALRSIGLIEKTLRLYETYLSPEWRFAIKVFMWPGFEELVRELKGIYGAANIVTYKPKACRKHSKETYVVKRG